MPSSSTRANSPPVQGIAGRCEPCRFITLVIHSCGATMSARTRRAAGMARIIADRPAGLAFCRRLRRNIIDQPRLAKAGGDEKTEWAVFNGLDAAPGVRVARLEIVDRKPGRFDRKPSLAHAPRDRLARRDPRCALL